MPNNGLPDLFRVLNLKSQALVTDGHKYATTDRHAGGVARLGGLPQGGRLHRNVAT